MVQRHLRRPPRSPPDPMRTADLLPPLLEPLLLAAEYSGIFAVAALVASCKYVTRWAHH